MGIHHGAMTPFQVPNFITAPNVLIQEYGARQLSRLAASGELHRVRRGLYLRTEQWDALKPWEQYRVSIQAVHELAHAAPVFARQSAAQIMGLPLILVPRLIETVAESKNGGQSSNGVHRLPAIDGDPPPWQMHGLLVTQPHITARDLAVSLPLAQSLPAMDRLLSMQLLPGAPANVPLTFPVKKIEEAISRLPNPEGPCLAGSYGGERQVSICGGIVQPGHHTGKRVSRPHPAGAVLRQPRTCRLPGFCVGEQQAPGRV